jgi:hypothetical protein
MPKGRYHVEVLYCTNAGNPGAWSGDVEAYNFEHAGELGNEICLRKRGRNIMKVTGGSVSQYDPPAIPSDPFVLVRRSVLDRLSDAAQSYLEDLESGIADGTYENTEDNKALVEQLQAALASNETPNFPSEQL